MRVERGIDNGKQCLNIWLEKHDIPSSAQKLTKNNWIEIFKKEREFWLTEFRFDKDYKYLDDANKAFEELSKESPNHILVKYKPNNNIPFILYSLIKLLERSDIAIVKNRDCDGDDVYENENGNIRYFGAFKLTESGCGNTRRFARSDDMIENLNWFEVLLIAYLENKPYILVSEFEVGECDDNSQFEPTISEQDFADLYVNKDVLVLCETKDSAEKLLKLANYFGYKWCTGDEYTDASSWDEYGKYTGYCIYEGTYGDIRWEELEFDEKIKFKETGYKNIEEIKNKRKEGIGVIFEIKDRVECIEPFLDIKKGHKGIIVNIEDECVSVNWDKNVGGWGSYELDIPDGHGKCIPYTSIKLLKRPKEQL